MLGVSALVLAGLLATASSGCADSMFYRPNHYAYREPESVGARDVSFSAADGTRLHGWWIEVPDGVEPRGTVVFCHGNSQNLTAHVPEVAWLPQRGYRLLLFDYRGYGRSEGETTRAGTVTDALAAIDLALEIDPDRTLVYGHSLGGAIGLVAAARRPRVRGIVAEATFTSYRAVGASTVGSLLGWLAWLVVSSGNDPVDFLDHLPPRPLLVIHGDHDPIVPFELGERLFEKAAEPKAFYQVEGGRHGSPWHRQGAEFEGRLLTFFERALIDDDPSDGVKGGD